MARRLVFRRDAQRDLDALYAYIRAQRGGSLTAISYIRRIRAFCEKLSTFPEMETPRDDLRDGLRVIGFERRVAIAYVSTVDAVIIGRVFYGGQDYEALLSDEPAQW